MLIVLLSLKTDINLLHISWILCRNFE